MLKRLTIVALAALAVACGDDRPILTVGTDGASFQRGFVPAIATSPIALVPYDIWNHGNATAFIPNCGTHVLPVIETLVNGRWETYSSGFCALSFGMGPVELREGETHHDELAIGDAGRYRIRVPYSADAHLRNHFATVSGQFDVH